MFRQRRDFLLPAVQELGFGVPCRPQGAFYIYADAGRFTDDSQRFCLDLLDSHGLAGVQLEIDGGVDLTNAADIVRAGADILVAGSSIYGAEDPRATAQKLFEEGTSALT